MKNSKNKQIKTVIIVGASGFLGKSLIKDLLKIKYFKIIATTRNKKNIPKKLYIKSKALEIIELDLSNKKDIKRVISPECVVINLFYNWHNGMHYNLKLMSNLVDVCTQMKIKRFVHLSTASVSGKPLDKLITENTQCNPSTEYGITKLKMEKILTDKAKDYFDCVILRPTSIFGPGGNPLYKLARDLLYKPRVINFIRSSLFGIRRMNLVTVKNVTFAIIFFINHSTSFEGDIYIISDDHNPKNNFNYIEKLLMQKLSIPYYKITYIMPHFILKTILFIMGKNNINPYTNFSSEKLFKFGFTPPVNFIDGLHEYGDWLRRNNSSSSHYSKKHNL